MIVLKERTFFFSLNAAKETKKKGHQSHYISIKKEEEEKNSNK